MKMLLILAMCLNVLVGCGFEQVDEGYRGIKTEWGKVVGEPLAPELYFYNPISSNIFEMDVRESKLETTEEAFTKDTQKVNIQMAVIFYPKPDKIGVLYSQFGLDYAKVLMVPSVLGAVKDTIGQINADDLVSKREHATQTAYAALYADLLKRDIVVTGLSFMDLKFDKKYEEAVEAKVVATQRASEAVNKTVQVQEEAKQKVMSAQADAEAMKIKSQALAQNKGLVEYEAVQRWNGQLPGIVLGNSVPIINLDSLTGKK